MSKQNHQVRIDIEAQGPYVVEGRPKLTRRVRVFNDAGDAVDWKDEGEITIEASSYQLCRCGHSEDKPFCDNHHEEIKWDDKLTADRAPTATRQKIYSGTDIIMTDDESLCAGYSFCDRYGGVWKEINETEDPAVREHIEQQVALCPAGRLEYKHEADGEPIEVEHAPTIAVVPDGPLWVLGNIPVKGPDGFTYEVRNRQTLCRCGQSKNKPYCDSTHFDSGFKAP